MSITISKQQNKIWRFWRYCQRVMDYSAIDAYKFLTKNAAMLVSLSNLSYDIPNPAAWDCSIGTAFHVYGQTILIEDDDLADALKRLPSDSQEIILRYYMLKQTEAQIALQLLSNQRTVSYKKNNALKSIRKWMEGKL